MEKPPVVPAEVYEELKMIAATREVCTLQFRAINGGITTLETKLKDVFEDEDGPFLLTDKGVVLQLYQLVSINGKPLEFYA
ncbi:MAG TPA: hypothetical protein VM010_00715 [Chitinophagaceae bacterium]|nr:hypothetical protein [Chitinophagaceae bacterium]